MSNRANVEMGGWVIIEGGQASFANGPSGLWLLGKLESNETDKWFPGFSSFRMPPKNNVHPFVVLIYLKSALNTRALLKSQ